MKRGGIKDVLVEINNMGEGGGLEYLKWFQLVCTLQSDEAFLHDYIFTRFHIYQQNFFFELNIGITCAKRTIAYSFFTPLLKQIPATFL